ncbi:MAG: hypothetical protein WCT14_20785, partial [Treponemataceae bacterium]
MKRTQIDVDRLIGELRLDCSQLEDQARTNDRANSRVLNGATDSLDYSALGYTIHNLYGIMGNACLRISKFFENGLSKESWHKELLDRMLVSIPRLRPAFLSRDAYLLIDELRGFRHVFRNLYNRDLDADRVSAIQKKVPQAIVAFESAVTVYISFLEELRMEL